MPRIPEYNAGQARNEALPTVRSSPNATAASFGGAAASQLNDVAEGFGKAGYVAGNIAIDIQERENADIVRGQMNAARLELNKFAQQQYSLNGSDAFGATNRIQSHAKKLSETFSKNFKNTVQKEMFENVFTSYVQEHALRAQGFEQNQRDAYRKQTLAQSNFIDEEDLVQGINDPSFVSTKLRDISQNTAALHSGEGDVASKVKLAGEGALLRAIQQQALSDPVAALVSLEAYQKHLNPASASTLKGQLETKASEMRVANKVVSIVSPESDPVSVHEAIDKDQSLTAEEKLDAHSKANTQLNILDHAKSKKKLEAEESAWNQFISSPSLETISALNVDPVVKKKMQDDLEKMNTKKTDDQYAIEYGKILRLHPDDFANLNLYEKRFDISPTQFANLKKEQEALRKGQKEKTPGLTQAIKDAETEAKKISLFEIGEEDSDDAVKQKQDRMHQYLAAYTTRLMQVPDEKRGDWVIQKKVRDELLAEIIINPEGWQPAFYNLWMGSEKATGIRQFEVESGAFPDPKGQAEVLPEASKTNDDSPKIFNTDGTDPLISVISPDGKKGKVPRSKLEQAIRQGYKKP